MARKVEKKTVAAAEPRSAADDLSALNPDVTLEIAGRKLTIREYPYFEGLEVAAIATGFLADIYEQCADGSLTYPRVRGLFAKHRDTVVSIAAQSANVEPEWVRGLGRQDAEYFMSTWFAVNVHFFVHELVVEIQVRGQRLAGARSTGSAFSHASPAPGSATSIASSSSPSDS